MTSSPPRAVPAPHRPVTAADGAALAPGTALRAALDGLAAQDRLLVALDFDGCLAPLVPHPEDARAVAEAAAAIAVLQRAEGVHVALVSGRDAATLRDLADPPPGVVLVGSHGAEFDGGSVHDDLDDGQVALLGRLAAEVDAIVARHPGTFREGKPAAAVLHTRRADRDVAERATREAVEGPATWAGVHTMLGKEIVELSVHEATKGTALHRLRVDLGLPPGAGGVLYAGDDVTDERAFAVLDDDRGDVTVKVGEGGTVARHRVADPWAVAALLTHLAERVGARGAAR